MNTHYFTTICFQRIWWINGFGGLTAYSLVLVHYIGSGKLWQIENFGGYLSGRLTRSTVVYNYYVTVCVNLYRNLLEI